MNKIYGAFDSIKLDDNVREKTYQKLVQQQATYNYKQRNLLYVLGAALTAVYIIFFANTGSVDKPPVIDTEVNIFTATENTNDRILYDGSVYLIDLDYDISAISVKDYIGSLNQIDKGTNLKNDLDSYFHDGYRVYNSSDQNVLVVKSNSENLVYKR